MKHEISRGDLEPQGPRLYEEVPDLPEEYGFENVNAFKELDEIFKQSVQNIQKCYDESLENMHKSYKDKQKRLEEACKKLHQNHQTSKLLFKTEHNKLTQYREEILNEKIEWEKERDFIR